MRRLVTLVTLLALLGAVEVVADATHMEVRDANDVRGRLDVRRVEVSGNPMRPRFKVATWSGWRARAIWDRGYVITFFDTIGGARSDYYILVRSGGRRMKAQLWRDRADKPDYVVARPPVFKSSGKTVVFRAPLRKMGLSETDLGYSWSLQTLYTNDACPRVCIDAAPDRGEVDEPIATSPTPSSSPTQTITAVPTTLP